MIKQKHIAIYGKLKMFRVYCEECKGMTLVLDDKKLCCDMPAPKKSIKQEEIIVSPDGRRKKPSLKRQKEILEKQDNKCLYCNNKFGTAYFRDGKLKLTKLHWEHLVPFSYTQRSSDKDFIASCNVCNLIKSDKVFETVEEVFHYVRYNRKKKGIDFHEKDEEMREM